MPTEPRPLAYQARCAIQAFKQTAYAFGALALGHAKSAAMHGAAATAWGALATYVAAEVKLGRIQQWMIDAMWVEPYDPMLADETQDEAN
jgi:hypothetical protein